MLTAIRQELSSIRIAIQLTKRLVAALSGRNTRKYSTNRNAQRIAYSWHFTFLPHAEWILFIRWITSTVVNGADPFPCFFSLRLEDNFLCLCSHSCHVLKSSLAKKKVFWKAAHFMANRNFFFSPLSVGKEFYSAVFIKFLRKTTLYEL